MLRRAAGETLSRLDVLPDIRRLSLALHPQRKHLEAACREADGTDNAEGVWKEKVVEKGRRGEGGGRKWVRVVSH